MSKRFVNSNIWDKSEFLDSNSESKLLFFFIISRCNNIGIFDISLKMASFQLGFEVTKKKVLDIPGDVEEIANGIFWLPNFCFHQYGILTESCPPHKKYINELKKLDLYERVVLGYSKGINTLQEKEEEQEKEKEEDQEEEKEVPRKKKFSKPTLEEVKNYCFQRINKVNPDKFFNYYESNGWKVGKNPMKDWKASIRTWESNEEDQKGNKSFRERDEDRLKASFEKTERMLYAGKLREFRPREIGNLSESNRNDVDSQESGYIGNPLGQEM